jgi:hypothetical protein
MTYPEAKVEHHLVSRRGRSPRFRCSCGRRFRTYELYFTHVIGEADPTGQSPMEKASGQSARRQYSSDR